MNALHPPLAENGSGEGPAPSQRLYHPPDLPHLQALKQRLELEWVSHLRQTLGIAADKLPLLWDCDFLLGQPSATEAERYVLCEINVSSVAPFPDSATAPLVSTTVTRLELARQRS